MAKLKRVSKISNYTKLFVGDKNHIGKMVREFRTTDKRFETEAAAVRYYVHLGVVSEAATEDLSNSLNHSIVKNSIAAAVEKELSKHSAHIEKLQNLVEDSIAKNEGNFNDIAIRTTSIEIRLDTGFEPVINLLKSLLKTGEQTLRNLIVLRSIFYVFFLGHQTGRIEPGKENLQKWNRMINLVHQKANALSLDEIKMLSGDRMETEIIRNMASEIFREVLRLPQPANEPQQPSNGSTLIL